MSRCSHSNDAGSSPSTVARFQSCSHNFCITGAIKAVIDAPWCHHARNMLLNRFFNVFGIHTISGTKLLRHFEFFGVYVNGDDFDGTRNFGALNNRQTLSTPWYQPILNLNCSHHV
jgi:hypothetical protein